MILDQNKYSTYDKYVDYIKHEILRERKISFILWNDLWNPLKLDCGSKKKSCFPQNVALFPQIITFKAIFP